MLARPKFACWSTPLDSFANEMIAKQSTRKDLPSFHCILNHRSPSGKSSEIGRAQWRSRHLLFRVIPGIHTTSSFTTAYRLVSSTPSSPSYIRLIDHAIQ